MYRTVHVVVSLLVGALVWSVEEPVVESIPTAVLPTEVEAVPEAVVAPVPVRPHTGVAFGPAICLVTNVPVGQSINLATSGQPFIIENRGPETADLSVVGVDPLRGGMPLWEYGYEPIPDATWIHCSPDSIGLGAPAQMPVEVSITVPDDPQWAGRKFVAGVRLGAGQSVGLGAGLAMCARLLFETTDRFQHDAGGGWLATIPGTVRVEAVTPGTSDVRLLRLRNGTAEPLRLTARRLIDAEPRPAKRLDYLTVQAVPAAWMPAPEPVELAIGGDLTLRLPFTVPADATPGSYEDVIVFATEEAWAVIDAVAENPAERRVQPRTAAVRIRFEVIAP